MIPAIPSVMRGLDVAPTAPAQTQIRPDAAAAAGNDFAAVLARVAGNAVGSMQAGEAASIRGVKDEASTQAVVEAVMGAERTVQTAVALRDKAINSYLELSRMAI